MSVALKSMRSGAGPEDESARCLMMLLFLLPLACTQAVQLGRRRRLELAPAVLYNQPQIVVATWDATTCFLRTRFYPAEILELHQRLRFPDVLHLDNRCVEDGPTALAILMGRLAIPCRHFDLTSIFGRERSVIGRIVRAAQDWLHSNWGHLLKWSADRLTGEKLENLADALVEEKGCPVPNCVGYIDGTVWKIARPGKEQRRFYNGHKRAHALKFQAVTTADGITVDLSEACLGSRHDQAILTHSGIEQTLREKCRGTQGQQMVIYGDAGYRMSDVIVTPFAGIPGRMPRTHRRFNRIMSSCRVSVEHEFGRTRNVLRMTQYRDNLKFFLTDLNQVYHVAVLMKNFLICVGRGSGGPIGGPTLAEYLH